MRKLEEPLCYRPRSVFCHTLVATYTTYHVESRPHVLDCELVGVCVCAYQQMEHILTHTDWITFTFARRHEPHVLAASVSRGERWLFLSAPTEPSQPTSTLHHAQYSTASILCRFVVGLHSNSKEKLHLWLHYIDVSYILYIYYLQIEVSHMTRFWNKIQ